MKRRAFLQQAGVALWTIGVGDLVLSGLGDRYYQALAQTNPRKLALLVGIDRYPQAPALAGCVTDVELQRELLLYRFGFQPSDILVLTDRQATRQNIEMAFAEHLIKQAKAGDVVVFHYSGYGNRINFSSEFLSLNSELKQEDALNTQNSSTDEAFAREHFTPDRQIIAANASPIQIQNSLVPVDSVVSTKSASTVNALLEETLRSLLSSLSTDRVTTVLDTSFAPTKTALQGGLRVRSRPQLDAAQLNAEEKSLLEELRQNSLRETSMPGIVLTASRADRLAAEGIWNGFSAGLFTYTLTQYFWQTTPPTTIQVVLRSVAGTIEQVTGKQQPRVSDRSGTSQTSPLTRLIPFNMGADGVLIAVEENGKTGQLWLAGLPLTVLDFYSINSLLTPLQPEENKGINQTILPSPFLLQISSREGLKAKVKISSIDPAQTDKLKVGQLVGEAIRVLPRNVGLTVALDANLERIERVDATSAFATVPNVSTVIAGEQPADCLFGRVQLKKEEQSTSKDAIATQYGLFSLGRELIFNAIGEPGEAVKTAVQRLTPKLQTQLAIKLLRLSANEGSSRLGVQATLEKVAPTREMLIQQTTFRAPWPAPTNQMSLSQTEEGILALPVGSQIQYQLHNYSDAPIYFILLGRDTSGSCIALFPSKSSPILDNAKIKPAIEGQVITPGETLTVPDTSSGFHWIVQSPPGLMEMQLIFSRAPFTQTIAALEMAQHPRGDLEHLSVLTYPLNVARAVLQDIHQASGKASEIAGAAADTLALDVNVWATLSFIYEVV